MKRTVLFATVVGVAVAVTIAEAGGSGASRIVDRTFVCTPTLVYGQVRDLNVTTDPPYKDQYRTTPAHFEVDSGADTPTSDLVVVRSRSWQSFGNSYPAGVYASSRRCAPARNSVPLSSRGLPGPAVVWAKRVECQVRGRVLVHIRAVLGSAGPWRRQDASYDGARKNVVSAKLAIRDQSNGKPIAYVELASTGKTRLWFSPSCG